MQLENHNLSQYIQQGFYEVDGWVQEGLIPVIDLLAADPINQGGGVAEIGVHHGRLFLLLNSLTDERDQSYAIDVFEDQHLNIDNSGQGSLSKFTENLEKYDLHQGKNVTIIKGDSTNPAVGLRDIIAPGSLKMISVDGGHTAEHTVNDLMIANHLVKHEGIVMLDDMPRHNWLGVTEGCVRFLETAPTLVPFAVGFNKMLFCKNAYYDHYAALMINNDLVERPQKFFGHTIMAFK